jgi:hypothetical protein
MLSEKMDILELKCMHRWWKIYAKMDVFLTTQDSLTTCQNNWIVFWKKSKFVIIKYFGKNNQTLVEVMVCIKG